MKTTLKLEKILTGGPYRVVTHLKGELEELKTYLPLLVCLRTPGMRERHWKSIYSITQINAAVSPTSPLCHPHAKCS